jgi:anti-sigma factor RsiW
MTDNGGHDVTGPGDETESLLGAYVLDAVDDVERRRVERLLDTDPAARAEVERMHLVADGLAEAAATGAHAPPDLLGSLMAKVADRDGPALPGSNPSSDGRAVGQNVDGQSFDGQKIAGRTPGRIDEPAPTPPPAVDPVVLPSRTTPVPTSGPEAERGAVASFADHAARRRSRAPWVLSAAAAVVLFVAGALVVGSRDDGATDPVAAMEQLAAEASTLPGARTGALTDPENTMAVEVVVDPEGHALPAVVGRRRHDDLHRAARLRSDDVGGRGRQQRHRDGHHHRARRRQPRSHLGPDGERRPPDRLTTA